MSQYVNLDRAAEVLGLSTGDVNRLREQGKIQGFRDGANWKFRQEDVERYLTQMIKEKSQGAAPSDMLDEDDSLFTLDDGTGEGDDTLGSLFGDIDLDEPAQPASNTLTKTKEPTAPVASAPAQTGDDLDFSAGVSSSSMMQDDDDLLLDLSGDDGLSFLDEPAGTTSDPDDIILGGAQPSNNLSDSFDHTDTLNLDAPAEAPADDDLMLVASDDDSGYRLADSEPALSLESAPAVAQDDDSLGLALADDDAPILVTDVNEPAKSTSDDQLNIVAEDEDDGDIFGLADEPEAIMPTMPATPPVSSDEDDFESLIAESESVNESFQLSASDSAQDESDSESASQAIALDENAFLDDSPVDFGSPYDPSNPFAPSSDLIDNQGSSNYGAPYVDPTSGSDFNPYPGGPTGFDPNNNGDYIDPVNTYPQDVVQVTPTSSSCPYKAGKDCEMEAQYSGLDISLLILPILFIIPASMGAYELIRTIWGWDQQYELFGPILQKIGELVNLTK